MLNRIQLLQQLSAASDQLFIRFDQQLANAQILWNQIGSQVDLHQTIKNKKWSVLVPFWNGVLNQSFAIKPHDHPYQVLAVDGSQIYYDRHQGPACYVINIGSAFFSYQCGPSFVAFDSIPEIIFAQNKQMEASSVNAMRDLAEYRFALQQSLSLIVKDQPFLLCFDGTLFFSQDQNSEQFELWIKQYFEILQQLYEHQILYAGYISFTASKELVNIFSLVANNFDDTAKSVLFDRLTDKHIASFFLKPYHRSMVFESKNPLSYLYPKASKPYFCFLHVGSEIARLEFPAWIALNELLLDQVCSIIIDQVIKGKGYPVCLMQAHEQAVIKAADREFFYHMLQKMSLKNSVSYQVSCKSLKKIQNSI